MSTPEATQALEQLAHAATLLDGAAATLAQTDLAPGHAAYFAWLVEQTKQRVTRAQIYAADAVRRTGAQQLDEPSFQAIADAGLHPSSKDLEATCGRYIVGRSYYKDPASMLAEWLNIGIGAARSRLLHADALVARVTEAGERLDARYPQLGQEFQRNDLDPGLLLSAATQLRKAEPTLAQAPNEQLAREELETDALALIRNEPATARKHLKGMIEQTVGEERSLAALLAEVGLFRIGMRNGLVYYRAVVLPQDAEMVESLRVQMDNPATIAGNRQELLKLAYEQYLATGDATSEGASAQPCPPPEWGEPETMPPWAQDQAAVDPDVSEVAAHGQEPETAGQKHPASPAPSTSEPAEQLPPEAPPADITAQGTTPHSQTGEIPAEVAPEPDQVSTPERPLAGKETRAENCPPGSGDTAAELIELGMPPELSLPLEELRPEFRHLMGLLSILRSKGTGQGKQVGVVQPRVTVILDYFKMLSLGKNFAVTENGLPLSAGAARTMLCNGDILPVVFGGQSKILDIAQESRVFPKHMRRALQAKYRGCAYPGCRMPASRCEIDHIKPWEEGGATSVDNGCLFCPMHHHARHCNLFTVIANEHGPPMVLLPKNLDPHQRPRLNTYWYSPSEAIEIARKAMTA